MKMNEVRDRARAAGLQQMGRMRKADLIRAIQRSEGNPECFGASWRFECQQINCAWRQVCLTRNPG